MAKGIVIRNLNVHKGEPSTHAPVVSQLVSGDEIQILDVVAGKTDDDQLEGSSAWYKLPDDQYVWSGGVSVDLTEELFLKKLVQDKSPSIDAITLYNPADYWWIKDFGIDQLWAQGLTGKGVKIAVLDSGLALSHPDITVAKENVRDFTKGSTGTIDRTGHGTHVTGIIAAAGGTSEIKGIAFDSEIFFGKVRHDPEGFKMQYLIDALEWVVEIGVDIVSISYGEKALPVLLERVIKTAVSKQMLIVCAAGNLNSQSGNQVLYPARFRETLSVGGCTRQLEPLNDSIDTDGTDLFAPGDKIKSTFKDSGYKGICGSSQAAPFVAGVAALTLQHRRKSNENFKALKTKDLILSSATEVNGYKIITPLNLIS